MSHPHVIPPDAKTAREGKLPPASRQVSGIRSVPPSAGRGAAPSDADAPPSSRGAPAGGLRWGGSGATAPPAVDDPIDRTCPLEPDKLDQLLTLARPSPPDAIEANDPFAPATLPPGPLPIAPVLPPTWETTRADAAASGSRPRWVNPALLALLATGALLSAAATVRWRAARPAPPSIAPAAPASPPSSAPVAAQPVSLDDRGAREALSRFGDGLRRCVVSGLGTLPGTSPAVPERLAQVGRAGFAAPAAAWRTPVWACARFRVEGPIRFQLQWQLVKPNRSGIAVAWIDDDGDGAADRAFAFEVIRVRKGEVRIGDIGPMSPARGVVRFR